MVEQTWFVFRSILQRCELEINMIECWSNIMICKYFTVYNCTWKSSETCSSNITYSSSFYQSFSSEPKRKGSDFCESTFTESQIENETSQETFGESRMRVLMKKLRVESENEISEGKTVWIFVWLLSIRDWNLKWNIVKG